MNDKKGVFLEKPSKIKKSNSNTIAEAMKTARQTILMEADAIENLIPYLDKDFEKAVTIVNAMEGRLVVTGIGKSAIIGQKIVATLNSTGTAALFLHAADAMHGDLGMVQATDVVLCISKSGETAEIKALVPMLKARSSYLIAMVAQANTYLALQANTALYTPVKAEADPNNLAPTTSTAVQLAMGDALAMALLQLQGFDNQDFAQLHPGGALGKQLYLHVRDIYPLHAAPKVQAQENIRAIILEMSSKRLGCAAVLNEQQQLIGVITDGDLRRMLSQEQDISQLQAKDIMTAAPKTVDKNALATQALELMRAYSITQLLVLDADRYVGVVHLHDLLKEGLV